jgi:hypothetical protein
VGQPDLLTPARAWTSAELVDLLRRRYRSVYKGRDRHALLEQVGNATGFSCNRHADAVVMELWPSDGLNLHGFEVKVSRGDWLRELKDPGKADAIARYCNCWWVVAPPNVVGPSELRPGWGLLEPWYARPVGAIPELRTRVSAVPVTPAPVLDRKFVAALLRRAARVPPK